MLQSCDFTYAVWTCFFDQLGFDLASQRDYRKMMEEFFYFFGNKGVCSKVPMYAAPVKGAKTSNKDFVLKL